MRKFKGLSFILCVCLLVSSLSVFAHAIDIEIDLSDLFKPSTGDNTGSTTPPEDSGNEGTTTPPADDDDKDDDASSGDKRPGKVETVDKTGGSSDKKEETKPEEKEEEVVYNSDFSDVTEDKWYFSYVKNLASKGIVEGYPDGTFMPQKNVTRAEFIKLLVVCMDYNISAMPSFDDVAQKDWYYTYVSTALRNGVITKEDYGTNLNPNAVITRAEAAKLLVRAAKLETGKYQTPYKDSEDEFVVALYTICLMQGEVDAATGDRHFKPETGITRAETSTVFSRLLEYNENPEKFVEEKMAEYGLKELKVLMTDTQSFNKAIYGIGVSPMSFYLFNLSEDTNHNDFSNSLLTSYENAFSHLPEYFTFTDLVINKEQHDKDVTVSAELVSSGSDFSIEELKELSQKGIQTGKQICDSLFSSSSSLSDMEKLETIYRYIVENTAYPEEENIEDVHYLPINVFEKGEGTCQAIASAFNILCRSAGFDVCAVSFDNHAFNCVLSGGQYLFFDCTYEITSDKTSDSETDSALNYFALSHEKMQNIHGNFSLPLAFWCTLE